MQNFLPAAFSKSQLEQRIGLPTEAKRLTRSLYHAGDSKGIANKGEQKYRSLLAVSSKDRVGRGGVRTELPDFNGDGFPRSQLCRLGKALSPRRDTYIEGFSIVETSIEDAKSRERNDWQALPLRPRDHGKRSMLVRTRVSRANEGQVYGASNPYQSIAMVRHLVGGCGRYVGSFWRICESLTREEPAAKRS